MFGSVFSPKNYLCWLRAASTDCRPVSSGTTWEAEVGYSRAVAVGDRIEVPGTTATDDDGAVVGVDDPHEQPVQVLENLERALAELEASLADVVRNCTFVTDVDPW